MIANITYGNYIKGLISYNDKKVRVGEASIFHSNIFMAEKLEPKQIERVFNSYTAISKSKYKNFHVSLNFTQEDYLKLTTASRKKIVEEYLKRIGFPEDHPFVGYAHYDKKHPHIHIITPRILADGKALKDFMIFKNSREISRALEKEFKLSNAEDLKIKKTCEKGNQFTDAGMFYRELNLLYKKKEIPLNDFLKSTVSYFLNRNLPTDMEEFQRGLSEIGIYTYKTGHKTPGLIYTTKQNSGTLKAKDTGIKSSGLGKKYTIKGLERSFQSNRQKVNKRAKKIAQKIDYIFFKYNTLNLETYQSELKKYDIELKPNISRGQINGFTYILKGKQYKGQDLPGRHYTQAKIMQKFTDQKPVISPEFILNKYIKKSKINEMHFEFHYFIMYAVEIGFKPKIRGDQIVLSLPQSDHVQLKTEFFEQSGNRVPWVNTSFSDFLSGLSTEKRTLINEKIEEILDQREKRSMENRQERQDLIAETTEKLCNMAEILTETPSDQLFDDIESVPKKKKRKQIRR